MKTTNIILLCIIIALIFLFVYNSQEYFVPVDALTEYKYCKKNIEFFKKVIDFLEKNGIAYWASCGTLLGAIRDKGMIPWDDDNDICIPENQISKIENKLNALENIGIGWTNYQFGYKFYDLNGIKTDYTYNYPFVDVFEMTKIDNQHIYKNTLAQSTWPKEYYLETELYPLKKIKYEYYEIYVPNDPISFLDRAYDGWRIKAIKTYDHLIEKQIKRMEFPVVYNLDKKPYLWVYWDNMVDVQTPPLIEMCYNTILINCSKSFDIVKLNKDNIITYLPEIEEYQESINKLQIAHKVDLYRIMLLYKYGGLYIDADTIVLKDPIEIMSKLDRYDYVGFGCSGEKCKYGYMKPSNGILASRPNTYLFGKILTTMLNKIQTVDKFNYFDLGKYLIWDELKKIEDYEYYHYPNSFDGTRDKLGKWVTTRIIFSDLQIDYENEDNMIFFTLYNSELSDDIKKLSANDILSTNWNVSKFLKRGLHI